MNFHNENPQLRVLLRRLYRYGRQVVGHDRDHVRVVIASIVLNGD